jgi:hypothetical protein
MPTQGMQYVACLRTPLRVLQATRSSRSSTHKYLNVLISIFMVCLQTVVQGKTLWQSTQQS